MKGWTLLELLVVLLVLVITSTAVWPAWQQLERRLALKSGLEETLSLLNSTRAEALLHQRVTVCSDQGCDRFPWSQGLVSWNHRGQQLGQAHLPRDVLIVWRGFRGTALVFEDRGRLRFQNGSLLLCHRKLPDDGHRVVLNWVGRPRVEAARTGDCLVD